MNLTMNLRSLLRKRTLSYESVDPVVHARFVVSVTALIVMVAILIFLYRYFYQTMAQARIVVVLQQEVALQNVDIAAFNTVYEQHQFKRASTLSEIIYDPFNTSVPEAFEPTALWIESEDNAAEDAGSMAGLNETASAL